MIGKRVYLGAPEAEGRTVRWSLTTGCAGIILECEEKLGC